MTGRFLIAVAAVSAVFAAEAINMPPYEVYPYLGDDWDNPKVNYMKVCEPGRNGEANASYVVLGISYPRRYQAVDADFDGELVIPAYIDGLPVRKINDAAFAECTRLTSVRIPSTVREIGARAFMDCLSLTTVTFDAGISVIGDSAFSNCVSIAVIRFPETLSRMGRGCFQGCIELADVYFEGNAPRLAFPSESDMSELGESIFRMWGFYDRARVHVNSETYGWISPYEKGIPEKWPVDFGYMQAYETGFITAQSGDESGAGGGAGAIGGSDGGSGNRGGFGGGENAGDDDRGEIGRGGASGIPDTMMPYAKWAVVYDGYAQLDDRLTGLVQLKVAKGKVNRKTGKFAARAAATVQLADGFGKVSFRNGMADETGAITEMTSRGWTISPVVREDCLGGTLRQNENTHCIDGVRNVFVARDSSSAAAASSALRTWRGAYNVVWNTGRLSIEVVAKGKVRISGAVGGERIAATSQLLVGDGRACIPVIAGKKNHFSFNVWLGPGGEIDITGVSGGAAVVPHNAVSGRAGKRIGSEVDVGRLPDGYYRFDDARQEMMRVRLSSKTGTIKGSFKVYTFDVRGRIKKVTVSVDGVMVGDIGYCTATIRRVGSWKVVIK